jgi:hypothetical protein
MSLDAVTTALVAIANSTAPTGVLVFDGEPSQDPAELETYHVVGSGLESGTSADQDLGNHTMWDTYDLIGYFRHTSGDVSVADDRNAVYAAFQPFRLAVQRDPMLGGGITGGGWARLSSFEFQMTDAADLDENAVGTYADLTYRITVTDLVRAT